MTNLVYTPSDFLRPYIKSYRFIESLSETTNRVLPDTSVAVAFRLRGRIAYVEDSGKRVLPSAAISGLRKSVRLINYAPETAALIVLFRESGVGAFCRQPIHELFGQSVALDNFFPQSETAALEERLAAANSDQASVQVVEQFLSSRLVSRKPDNLVEEALRKIATTQGAMRVRELANSLCISQDAFEKRFRRATGASPKQFSSIVRMKSIIRHTRLSSSFLDTALDNGYYDQAHFNKDFRTFTGMSPTNFFNSAVYW